MKFALLTPTSQLAEMEASYISLPGEAGDFGVLEGHMPLVSTLRANAQLVVTDTAGKAHTFTVTGGVADVKPTGVTVLAETATAA